MRNDGWRHPTSSALASHFTPCQAGLNLAGKPRPLPSLWDLTDSPGLARGGVVSAGQGVAPLAACEVAPGDRARAPDPRGRAEVPPVAVPRCQGREQIGAVPREDRERRAVRRDRE